MWSSKAGRTMRERRRCTLRLDALAGAAEWIGAVECEARTISGLVATVGRLDVSPGADNVIAR